MESTSSREKFGNWLKNSISARMIMIGFLIILLSIPLYSIRSLITERELRQKSVTSEINEKWGNEVILYGPILKLPYKSFEKVKIFDEKSKEKSIELKESIEFAYFFPKQLQIESTINPQEKKRGIYTTAVYKSDIKISGEFQKPDFSEGDISEQDVLWDKGKLVFKISNIKGMHSLSEIKLNENEYPLSSTYMTNSQNIENSTVDGHYYQSPYKFKRNTIMHKLETKYLAKNDLPNLQSVNFNLSMKINGSEKIQFIPIGEETNVDMKSNWPTANFIGDFLPYNDDKITDKGFHAKWKVLAINRPFAQQFFGELPNLNNHSSGVNFLIPVDEYQKSERSVKYGFLVIGLTFLIFFLIQTINKIAIHPFQYLLIGLALVIFYTLLLAISEHSSFLKAYIISSIAVISLISIYSKSIIKQRKLPTFIALSLTSVYLFIYVIIQLENYALLVGSIGLFTILVIIMYFSKKIDWN